MALRQEQDVVLCRNRARTIAAALRFDRQQQVRIATAVSEIARNAFRYASEATAEFSLTRSRTGTSRRITQSFVTIVRDRGPGIGDLRSILNGTYQTKSGRATGILAAKRLMDSVQIDTEASGTTVRLVQELPKGVDLNPLDLQRIASEINRSSQGELLDELAAQNEELITTFDQLNTQRVELKKINEELSETNRGVVALYDELDTVQRVGRVVASKLDLGALLQAIADATVDVTGAECGAFFRREPGSANFTCQTVAGPLGIALQGCSLFNLEELIASGTEQEIFHVNDLSTDKHPSPLSPPLPIRSFLALSVRDSKGEIVGALAFAHRSPAFFTERTERILAVVAVQVSIGLENAQLYRSAQAASAAKDQFLAILSHELRTPLTPIFAILSAIEQYPDLPEAIRSDLLAITRNLQLETRLIDDLLDLTRINQGKLSLQREIIDVHSLIRSVRNLCENAIAKQQVRVAMQLEAARYHVLGDAGRLQQVFWNLLSNAIKFTPAGGTIELRTSVVAGAELRIQLTDSGRGIGLGSLERIFQPFDQGDLSVAPRFGGLGLGLAISRGIVDAHEGKIRADSPGLGRGATLTVTLPLAETEQLPNAPPPTPKPPAVNKAVRVLLVDDHEDTLEFMGRLLRLSGREVVTASTYGEALNIGRRQEFDLVISDIGLPGGSGYDLLPALQTLSPLKGIALSGYGMKEDVDRSMAAGFSAHLTKPCDVSVLNATIEKVLS
ncbi:MAG TPA: ATP-binding protein [Chthoniobacterales bacterium]|nr:ATP-binding protein [Chthoniobacterales bacterium]